MAKPRQKSTKSEKPELLGWYSPAELADFLGIDVATFHARWRKYAPAKGCKRDGHRLWIRGREFFDGAVASEVSKQLSKAGPVGDVELGADELLSGGNSPALEDYRRAQAKLRWLDVAEREGALVKTERIRGEMNRLAGLIRKAGEQIGSRYGRDAQSLLFEALDEYEAGIKNATGIK